MITAAVLATALMVTGSPSEPPPPLVKHITSQRGVQDSAYTGRYFNPADEGYRKCIAQREGGGIYWINTGNGYYGTYQVTGPLSVGSAWMIQPELKTMFGAKEGTRIGRLLRSQPMSEWHRFYADMAFWTVLNWKGRGSGSKHWAGGRWSCTLGMKWRTP